MCALWRHFLYIACGLIALALMVVDMGTANVHLMLCTTNILKILMYQRRLTDLNYVAAILHVLFICFTACLHLCVVHHKKNLADTVANIPLARLFYESQEEK